LPCREELPHLQKLYDRIKDRKDIQLATFNVDDQIGAVAPFMKANNYTFPVLFAKSLVQQLAPSLTLPAKWVVDGNGVVVLQKLGREGDGEKWVDQLLEMLEKARKRTEGRSR
jgi:hypothetical protein